MHQLELDLPHAGRGLTDITDELREFCSENGSGLVNVFAPHSTVGLALAQLDGGSEEDILEAIGRLVPRDGAYHHREKAPGHGADHIIPVLVSPSVTIPVVGSVPALGEFQRLLLLDLDEEPSPRRVVLTFLTDGPPGS